MGQNYCHKVEINEQMGNSEIADKNRQEACDILKSWLKKEIRKHYVF